MSRIRDSQLGSVTGELISQFDPKDFVNKYSRSLYNAIRKAAKITGADVLEQYRDDGLEGTKRKRQTAVKYAVRKNNTLVWIDSGLDARIREYGATIRPKKGKSLKVVIADDYREWLRRDAAKGRDRDYFLFKRPGDSPLLMRRDGEDQATPVAVLKRQVRREPVNQNDKLSNIADRNLKKYMGNIEEFIADV